MSTIDWNKVKRELGMSPGETAARELDRAQGIEPAQLDSTRSNKLQNLFTKIPPHSSKR